MWVKDKEVYMPLVHLSGPDPSACPWAASWLQVNQHQQRMEELSEGQGAELWQWPSRMATPTMWGGFNPGDVFRKQVTDKQGVCSFSKKSRTLPGLKSQMLLTESARVSTYGCLCPLLAGSRSQRLEIPPVREDTQLWASLPPTPPQVWQGQCPARCRTNQKNGK